MTVQENYLNHRPAVAKDELTQMKVRTDKGDRATQGFRYVRAPHKPRPVHLFRSLLRQQMPSQLVMLSTAACASMGTGASCPSQLLLVAYSRPPTCAACARHWAYTLASPTFHGAQDRQLLTYNLKEDRVVSNMLVCLQD